MAPVAGLTEFSIRVATEHGRRVVQVWGDVDLYTAPRLERQLEELVEDGVNEIVLDASEVTFMDVTGVAALARTLNRLPAREGCILVRSPSRSIQKMLEITGLDQFLLYE